jgi:small redox-active disulfide protein 2
MKIQVLGSGCSTCKKLFELTKKAVDEMGLEDKPEYLTGAEGMQKIVDLGVMQSPVLTVNGQVAMTGFVADIKKIKEHIQKVLKKDL